MDERKWDHSQDVHVHNGIDSFWYVFVSGSILAGCKEVQIVQSLPLGPIRNALEFLRDPDIRLTSLLQFVKFCNANEISSTRFLNSTAFVQAN